MGNMRKGHIAWSASQVWERLFIGGLADAEELAEGNPHRITTVVSLSEIPVESKRRDINYLHLPIEDDEQVPIRQFYGIMDAIRKNIRWGTVLLNCGVGVSRAPSLAAAYMDAVGYKGIDAAIKEIRKARPFIHPSDVLLNSIRRYL
jgi:protein-tyrosine phosphatase